MKENEIAEKNVYIEKQIEKTQTWKLNLWKKDNYNTELYIMKMMMQLMM